MSISSLRHLLAEATPELWFVDGGRIREAPCEWYPAGHEIGSWFDEENIALVCELRNHAEILLDIAEAAQMVASYASKRVLVGIEGMIDDTRIGTEHYQVPAEILEALAAALARLSREDTS